MPRCCRYAAPRLPGRAGLEHRELLCQVWARWGGLTWRRWACGWLARGRCGALPLGQLRASRWPLEGRLPLPLLLPALAGLPEHVWTLREVLRFRVPPWPQPAEG